MSQRIQKHATDLRHCRTYSSSLEEHAGLRKHHICLEESRVLARVDHLHHRKLREAIEIEKRNKTLNRDDGWKLSTSWVPSLCS